MAKVSRKIAKRPNRVRIKKPIRFRNRGDSPLSPAASGKRGLLLQLAQEYQQVNIESMEGLGLSRKEQMFTYHRASKGVGSKDRPSEDLMDRIAGIADLLSSWRRDRRYVGPDGTPCVLPIKGRGASLETLARKFVPKMSVSEVLTAITRHGEVVIRAGGKVALIGVTALITPKTAEMTLALLVNRVRRISQTLAHNASLPEGSKGQGRFERHVFGVLSEREFNAYAQGMRGQFQDFCDRAESGLELAADKRGRKRRTCGIGIFLFRDD